ncbi:hypothetical protein D3C86_723670 [compost metagenome]
MFALGSAFGEAVLDLNRRDRCKTAHFGQQVGAGDAPRREVRQSGVMDLAGAYQIVETAQDFFHRRHAIAHVRPEQIDVIGFQSLQALFDGANHVLSAVTRVGNAGGRGRAQCVFCGDDQTIALGSNEFAEHGFGLTALITVGGVDEVTASLQVTVENGFGFVTFRTMAPTGAEVAGAQCQFGYTQAGFTAKHLVMHGEDSRRKRRS